MPTDQYTKLFERGKLVQVHVSMWGMAFQLAKEDLDLVEVPKIFQLGKKYLINPAIHAKFKHIEGLARNYLRANSFQFPVAEAHFVPQKTLFGVLDGLNKFKATYDVETQKFYDNYDAYREQHLKDHEEHRDALEPFYPKLEVLKPKFGFSISMFEIQFPKELQEVDYQQLLVREEMTAEMRAKLTVQLEQQKKEAARKMEGFVSDCVAALRVKVVEASQHVMRKIQNREVITKTNLTTLKETIDSFDNLNFFDDKKVSEELKKLRAIVTSNADFKENRDAIHALNLALGSAVQATKDVSDLDKLSGELFRSIEA